MDFPAKPSGIGSSTPRRLTAAVLPGELLLEGRPVHVPDVSADSEYRATRYQDLAGYRTVLAVPLLRGETVIGVFGLTRGEVNPFTEKQIELVTTFADQAVIAIENVRLFEAEQQRTRELSESLEQQTATSKVLEVISRSAFDLQAVFETVAESSVKLCGARQGAHLPFRWRTASDGGGLQRYPRVKGVYRAKSNSARPSQCCCPRRARTTNDPHSRCPGRSGLYVRGEGFRGGPDGSRGADTQRR